jgi:hypothetical protein
MTQPPDDPRADEPGIDLSKPRPGAAPPPPPPPPQYQPPYEPQQGGWQQPGGWRQPVDWQQPGSRLSPADERTWAGAAHWSAIVAAIVVLAFLGPLVVLLIKGNDSPFVRRQAVESLNFQLTILIAAIVSFALIFVVIGLLLLPLVGLAWLVFTIVGAVKASSGEDYRYPFALRMVR